MNDYIDEIVPLRHAPAPVGEEHLGPTREEKFREGVAALNRHGRRKLAKQLTPPRAARKAQARATFRLRRALEQAARADARRAKEQG